jgi:hypothetical protein
MAELEPAAEGLVLQDRAGGVGELDAGDAQLVRLLAERAQAGGISLVGEGGLLAQLTKLVLEAGLEAEMSDHLGYDKHDPMGRNGGNSRNGTRTKTVLTETGPVDIEVPRDREASFAPVTVPKRVRRLRGVDEMVVSLVARGMMTGDVQAHLAEVYDMRLSRQQVSDITDAVVAKMGEWQNRPLDAGRFPVIVANQMRASWRRHRDINCAGVRSARHRRGRSFSSSATSRRRASSTRSKLVPLGKYYRRRPFVFSFVGRCQGECGAAK